MYLSTTKHQIFCQTVNPRLEIKASLIYLMLIIKARLRLPRTLAEAFRQSEVSNHPVLATYLPRYVWKDYHVRRHVRLFADLILPDSVLGPIPEIFRLPATNSAPSTAESTVKLHHHRMLMYHCGLVVSVLAFYSKFESR